jgi:hypothetical protein
MASALAGTYWENYGYIGELYTASRKETPFLSAIGYINEGIGGGKVTTNFEFPVANQYSLTAAAGTAITEDATKSAPGYVDHALTQYKNVCEIHYLGVEATYVALATWGRISGVATAGQVMTLDDLLAHKIMIRLAEIARNIEYRFLGVGSDYACSTDADVANKTRGLIECASNASNTVAAGSIDLNKDLVQTLLRTMYAAGAQFVDPVIIVNAFQKQKISEIFGYAPTDRNIGGVDIKQIEIDLIGNVPVLLDPIQPTSVLTVADLGVCSPVFQQVPGKPLGIFYEEHGRTAAMISGQLFGMIGLDHGPYFAHGTITGLTTS